MRRPHRGRGRRGRHIPFGAPDQPGISLVAQRLSLPSGPALLRDCTSAVRAGASRSVLLESTSREACGLAIEFEHRYRNHQKKKKTMKMRKQCLGMLKIVYDFISFNISSFAVSYTYLSTLLRCVHPAPISSCSYHGAILARGYTITLRPLYGQLVI